MSDVFSEILLKGSHSTESFVKKSYKPVYPNLYSLGKNRSTIKMSEETPLSPAQFLLYPCKQQHTTLHTAGDTAHPWFLAATHKKRRSTVSTICVVKQPVQLFWQLRLNKDKEYNTGMRFTIFLNIIKQVIFIFNFKGNFH